MSSDPPVPATSLDSGQTSSIPTMSTPTARSRSLRVRPSDPGPPVQNVSPIALALKLPVPSAFREPTPKELNSISRRLGEDTIRAKREELVAEKEQKLKQVIDSHDDAIREKFHLERFVTMITGWDPKSAKVDNSPVFVEWRDNKHNLLSLLPPSSSIPSPSSQAGPSRPRTSLPARTTRRAAHEQSEILAQVVTPVTTSAPANGHITSIKGKGKAVEPLPEASPANGSSRVKRRNSEYVMEHAESLEETPVKGKPGRKKRESVIITEMPPPPVPVNKGKTSRRTTMGVSINEVAGNGEVNEEMQDTIDIKGKKRGRMSLPNLPAAKKTRGSKVIEEPDPEPEPSPSPVIEAPRESSHISATPVPLPSLSHLPFPPPPRRSHEKLIGAKKIRYTDPTQKPPASPKHGGHVSPILESYINIEDNGPSLDLKILESRANRDGYFRARVLYLQSQGRLQRLLDEIEDPLITRNTNHKTQPKNFVRKTDFQDSLMAHMVQVRNAMLNEAKMKPVVCKRMARMIQTYWERIEGREEREKLAEEKERKRLGKELVKGLRKRWALAVKIVRAKLLELQKIEQDRLGKEHLQNILQRSTGLLEAQVAGQDEEDSQNDSEATDDVSSADNSDEVVEEEQEDFDEETERVEELDLASSVPPDPVAGSEDILEPQGDGKDEKEEEREDEDEDEDEDGNDDDDVVDSAREVDLSFLVADDVDVNQGSETGVKQVVAITERSAPVLGMNGQLAFRPTDTAILEVPRVGGITAFTSPASPPAALSSPDPIDSLPTILSSPTKVVIKGHTSPSPSLSVAPVPRSRRARKIKPPSLVTEDDPDANDIEFTGPPTSDIDEQDVELDVEMEDEDEDEERDSEDDGLKEDADMPIEELLKRYGYPVPSEENPHNVAEDIIQVNGDSKPEEVFETNGHNTYNPRDEHQLNGESLVMPDAREETVNDQSLLDDQLPPLPVSPQLIVEGKRQRRARSVWSPKDELPQQLSTSKKPKLELVNHREGYGSDITSDHEEEEEEEEEEEDSEEDDDAEDGEGEVEEDEKMEVDDGPRVRQPFLLRGTLRPYQQAGLEWLASLWENGMNGILADEMGLGKTIQTISLLGHLACDKGIWGQHLIIVPTSVILNWEMEFKKFFPGMKVLTYYGNQKERKEKRIGWHTENAWQVCITSYQIVLADQHIFRRKSWTYMILDEAHNIKNFRSQRWQTLLGFKARRRLLLTGTPLQNNLMELWSLLYFLMPGGIGADATAVVGFANHKDFMEWFSNPMDKAIEASDAMDEDTLAVVSKLHTLLRPFILRRLKSEVETQLPGKFEHVVYCRLSKRQRFLYDEFMARASTREALSSGGYLGVMNTLMQLRKVCNHPDLFEVRPVRTSFAMDSVASDFEPKELLVRRRLLAAEEESKFDILASGLGITANEAVSGWVCRARNDLDASEKLPHAIEPIVTRRGKPPAGPKKDTRTVEGWLKYSAWAEDQASIRRWRSLRDVNQRRCSLQPIYGSTFLNMLGHTPNYLLPLDINPRREELFADNRPPASNLVVSLPNRAKTLEPVIDLFAVIPPNVVARDMPQYALPGLTPTSHPALLEESFDTLHRSTVKLQIAFPDSSLLQYDCGKLQTLYTMLRDLKAGGHRVLIFTQMTKVLDILEIFLSYNGHRYLRLDGSTKIEDRQIITERFNSDPRFFVFIASSRSGGVGINLTGADTVFFYDSDWNPSMDRQCMDRAHRIGQTREVHIYRFVSSHTVEENMLRKAEQKRLLDKMVIQQGSFNNDWWGKVGWKDMFGEVNDTENSNHNNGLAENGVEEETEEAGVIDVDVENTPIAEDVAVLKPRAGEERELARVLAEVEDEEDVQAARIAQNEGELDFQEFDENTNTTAITGNKKNEPNNKAKVTFDQDTKASVTPLPDSENPGNEEGKDGAEEEEEGYEDDGIGGVEEYMLNWVEQDWSWFINYRA
ncbi:uncharacterized protein IL334_003551 [Kwoniella shivajii]|uniref:Helicase SWR1 n=1 Tax=Kwoniella shivajii TaxID=564305 RepID=A0ABZ1CXX0_9TREE|nr:hypothetical protein IL334_003551 [Kwoniella shivajii]